MAALRVLPGMRHAGDLDGRSDARPARRGCRHARRSEVDQDQALQLATLGAFMDRAARGRRGGADRNAAAAYSTLMFADLTTFSQRARSARTCSKNSRG